MQFIFEKFGFIVGFFVFCVIFQTLLGGKMLNEMLILVLVSVIVYNADAFVSLLKGV